MLDKGKLRLLIPVDGIDKAELLKEYAEFTGTQPTLDEFNETLNVMLFQDASIELSSNPTGAIPLGGAPVTVELNWVNLARRDQDS